MPFYEGYIHKDSIQFFRDLPKQQQKLRINKALTGFYSICNSDLKVKDSVYYTLRDFYYSKTFYPILEQFFYYYSETKDTATLRNFFNAISCNPDGEFATTFAFLIGHCYDLDKKLFTRQIVHIRNIQSRKRLTNILLASVDTYYRDRYLKKKIDPQQIERLLESETNLIFTLTKASR